MAPGEEDEEQLIDDVGVGDVKVMFQRGDINVLFKLKLQLVQVHGKY